MLDCKMPIRIMDDRTKVDDVLVVNEVIWQDGSHALVRVAIEGGVSDADFSLGVEPDQPLLIDLQNGHVINSDFDSWIAENVST